MGHLVVNSVTIFTTKCPAGTLRCPALRMNGQGPEARGGRKGNMMLTRDARRGPSAAFVQRIVVTIAAVLGSIVVPTGDAVATPEADCADPAAWAAANGAVVVELTEATPVAVLFHRPGPYAVVGSAVGDVILGSLGGDLICGNGGRDVIWSGGGNDIIDGGDGRDIVLAGSDVDECSTDDLDVVRGCESVERVASSITVAAITALRHDKVTTNTVAAPLVPLLSCVRERSDGLMEAVLGHRTQVAESFYGSYAEVDENLAQTSDVPLPQFFFEGAHPHTVAVAFDPLHPPRLWLEPDDFRFLNNRQWRFDIQLGSGLPECSADVPTVLPIIGEIYPGGGDPFEVTFAGSGPLVVGGAANHFFRVTPTATSACTGASATPIAPDFKMVFNDSFGVAPLSSGQIEATLSDGYVVSTTSVRRFSVTGSTPVSASTKLSADLFPRCQLANGTIIAAENPVWYSRTDSTITEAIASYTPANDEFTGSIDFATQSGFSRFR